MTAIQKLAIRNLKEHKSKTIIISLFLIFGIALVIMGNSFLESINNDLEKDFRKNYTGDICISIKPKKGQTIDLFSATSSNITLDIEDNQIPCLVDIEPIENVLNKIEEIDKKTKFISSQVLVSKGRDVDFDVFVEEESSLETLPMAILFAGEEETYWDTFPNINFIEGTYPKKDSNEVIIDARLKESFEKTYKKELKIGDRISLSSLMGTTIRDGMICGIFKPDNEYSAMFQCVYCSPNFARSFAKLTYGNIKDENINYEEIEDYEAITNLSDDALFSDEIENLDTSVVTSFDNILGDTTKRDKLNKTDDGAWQFIILKLKNQNDTEKIISELNTTFKNKGINARAMNWKLASLSYSSGVEGVRSVFNLLIFIFAVVIFIIIMNTMIVSIMERTSEIGTMRALGANRKFIKKLFYTETFILTFVSSLIGIFLSLFIMYIFNSFDIEITNSITKALLGGGLLHFSPTLSITLNTLFIAIFGSILSNIYPIKASLKITPLKALSKAIF